MWRDLVALSRLVARYAVLGLVAGVTRCALLAWWQRRSACFRLRAKGVLCSCRTNLPCKRELCQWSPHLGYLERVPHQSPKAHQPMVDNLSRCRGHGWAEVSSASLRVLCCCIICLDLMINNEECLHLVYLFILAYIRFREPLWQSLISMRSFEARALFLVDFFAGTLATNSADISWLKNCTYMPFRLVTQMVQEVYRNVAKIPRLKRFSLSIPSPPFSGPSEWVP